MAIATSCCQTLIDERIAVAREVYSQNLH